MLQAARSVPRSLPNSSAWTMDLCARSLTLGLVLVLCGASMALSDSSRGSVHDRVQADTTKPLRPLMVGLGQDTDRIATGIWYEEYDWIEEGARSIAQHPKISPVQIKKIKSVLGAEFEGFVACDKSVHNTARTLVKAARARDWSAVLDARRELQQGCMGCHTAYRDRLRPVLTRQR